MKKLNIDSSDVFLFVCLGLIGFTIVFAIEDVIARDKYSHKHDNFRPIPGLSRYMDVLCYSIGDSTLNARKARFDSLVKDYNEAFETVGKHYDGILSMTQKFDKIYVTPKYATQIGATNIRQYSKYIDRYKRDSLVPAYTNVYNNRVIPMIRNNTKKK